MKYIFICYIIMSVVSLIVFVDTGRAVARNLMSEIKTGHLVCSDIDKISAAFPPKLSVMLIALVPLLNVIIAIVMIGQYDEVLKGTRKKLIERGVVYEQ